MSVNIAMQLQTLVIAGFFMILYNNLNRINYKNIYNKLFFLIDFYNYICEHNPLLIDYYDETPSKTHNTKEDETKLEELVEIVEKFEEKYLQKFNQFPNEYCFDESELNTEYELVSKVKSDFEKDKTKKLNELQETLLKINNITNGVTISETGSMEFGEPVKTMLLNYYDITDYDAEYDDNKCNDNNIDFNELYLDLLTIEDKLKTELHNVKQTEITDEEALRQARELTINAKLEKYMNNYVLEHTPLGNIYMRYNSAKGSFEYFSNNTIPYRYLEPVGRKYVMTYWCKPIFVSLEDELKKAEIKYDEDKKKEEELRNKPRESKDYMAKLKSYNNETRQQTMMKNQRPNPPQIKANLANVTQKSEKLLLKEHANRYTWEGRISNFCPLKKIDRKIVDKNLTLTYADFKKMSQNKK
jgi:hypothetical protein